MRIETDAQRPHLGPRLINGVTRQIRLSLRLLTRNPLFAVVAIGTWALAIAAHTAVFSAVDALLLHPLHFQHAEQLVFVTKNMPMFDLSKSDPSGASSLGAFWSPRHSRHVLDAWWETTGGPIFHRE